MFPFDQAALPQFNARKALIAVDFQNDFTAEDGCLPVSEPPGFVQRAAELASAFREKGDVVWVKSGFDSSRGVDGEQIITADKSASSAPSKTNLSGPRRLSRQRIPVSVKNSLDAAGAPDPEAFLSHEEPLCLKSSSSSACDWDPRVKDVMQKNDMVLVKSHYSAFKETKLLHILRAKMVMEVFICGSLANIGVYATAMDAAGHGLTITVIEDCCGYRSEERQQQAIRSLMEFTGCDVASSKEVLESIQPPRSHLPITDMGAAKQSTRAADIARDHVSKSPDLVRPMTSLRLASDSPAPVHTVAAGEVGSDSQSKLEELPRIEPASPPPSKPTSPVQGNVDLHIHNESPSSAPSHAHQPEMDSKPGNNGEQMYQRGLCEGDTDVIEDLMPSELVQGLFDKLREEIRWQHMSHQGGEVPRLVAVQGEVADDGSIPVYRHPSDESPPLLPFSPSVLAIKAVTEKHLGHTLNHALIQYYRDGRDYISEHSDKTLDIAKNSYIANVSLGAERVMVLRTKRQDKDPSLEKQSPSDDRPKRQVQRARLPHNSLCRMGLRTNMKWLHAIRQDKRADRDKVASELAFSGGRISLTFRKIGTFLSKDEKRMWGQGATGKTRAEARDVINGTTAEAIGMLKAFGAENHSSTFDWGLWYGKGFNVLHMSSSPRFFASPDPLVNMRIVLMLAELGINYAKGSMGPPVTEDMGESEPEGLPIKFVDNDVSKSVIQGDVAIMMYLDAIYGQQREGKPIQSQSSLAKIYTRFQQALYLSAVARRSFKSSSDSETSDIGVLREHLVIWNGYAAELEGGCLAGMEPTLADFVVWPVLRAVADRHGEGLLEGLDLLKAYYSAYGDRESVKSAVRTASQGAAA